MFALDAAHSCRSDRLAGDESGRLLFCSDRILFWLKLEEVRSIVRGTYLCRGHACNGNQVFLPLFFSSQC
jgi:hypothetical protein